MKESFSEYKKTLDRNLIKFEYLYSGDIISSQDKIYTEVKKNSLVSPSTILNCINRIYVDSIDKMISKSIDTTIPILNKDDSIKKINGIMLSNDYHFTSSKFYDTFGFKKVISRNNSFPEYFYPINSNRWFISPNIIEFNDQYNLYLVDKPIQSLIYIIQNMEYDIEYISKYKKEYKHIIKYKIYDCDYTCKNFIIKDTLKIRDEKIENILNVNR